MKKLLIILKMIVSFPIRIFTKKSPFALIRNSKLHKESAVLSGSRVNNVKMGKLSYIGRNCLINNTNIGAFCSIADSCFIGLGAHPTEWLSTSPVFNANRNVLKINLSNHTYDSQDKTIIGNDVWIGVNSIIMQGVNLGNGSIVGAGAVVTKDVPPYAIVGGVPARVIKYRFDEDLCNDINKTQWWKLDIKDLKKLNMYIINPQEFVEEMQAAEGVLK